MEQYHTGLVVPSIDKAMAELSAAFGVSWRPVAERLAFDVWTPLGPRNVSLRRVYSVEGPPYIELIEQTDGDPTWGDGFPAGGYHVGYWSGDIDGDVAALEAAGLERAVCDLRDDGKPGRFCYLTTSFGTVVELVPTSRRADVLG